MRFTDLGTRRSLGMAVAFWLGAAGLPAVHAQGTFPDAAITLILPFPAGSVTDAQMRALSLEAGRKLGQQIVIVNKPGATGTLGPSTMAKTARPDGYTLSVVPSSLVGLPHMQKVNYDPLKDFTYIIGITGYSFALAVQKDAPWKNIQEFLAYARANPGKATYGSAGIGGGNHLAMAQLERCQNAPFTHVPFKGGAEVTVALLGAQIDSMADGSWGQLSDSGRARPLLILTPSRVADYPDIPTLKDLCPDVYVDAQEIGIAGPHGMDPQVVQKIHNAFRDSMATEAFAAALKSAKQVPLYLSARDYTGYMETTFVQKGKLVKLMDLKVE